MIRYYVVAIPTNDDRPAAATLHLLEVERALRARFPNPTVRAVDEDDLDEETRP